MTSTPISGDGAMPSIAVLLIDSGATRRSACAQALWKAGCTVTNVSCIAEVERWPAGEIVVTDADHCTRWWKQIGATHVILLDAIDATSAARMGVDHTIGENCSIEDLVHVVFQIGRGSLPPLLTRPANTLL